MKSGVRSSTSIWFQVSTLLLLASVYFVIQFAVQFVQERQTINETSIGYIALDAVNETELQSQILNGVVEWRSVASYNIIYQDKIMELDLSVFPVDISQTIDHIIYGTNNSLEVNVTDTTIEALKGQLRDVYGYLLAEEINIERLASFIEIDVEQMATKKYYSLVEYLPINDSESIVNSSYMIRLDPIDTAKIGESFTRIEIPANTQFSLLDTIGEYQFSDRQMSIIGAAVKDLITQSNLTNISYIQFEELPTWTTYGNNVRILDINEYDLTFYNPNNYSLFVDLKSQGASYLEFVLKGYPFIDIYDSNTYHMNYIPYEIEYVNTPSLDLETEGVTVRETESEYIIELLHQVGEQGREVETYRTTVDVHNDMSVVLVSREQYLPITEIIYTNTIEKVEE